MIREAHCPGGRRPHQPPRKAVLKSIQAVSMLTIMEIVGPVLLLAVLIYGTLQWSRRRRGPTQAVREASTRELYREGARAEKREEAGKAPAGKTTRAGLRPCDRSAVANTSPGSLNKRMSIELLRKRLSAEGRASSSPACRPPPTSLRPAPTGFTRSSTTASG